MQTSRESMDTDGVRRGSQAAVFRHKEQVTPVPGCSLSWNSSLPLPLNPLLTKQSTDRLLKFSGEIQTGKGVETWAFWWLERDKYLGSTEKCWLWNNFGIGTQKSLFRMVDSSPTPSRAPIDFKTSRELWEAICKKMNNNKSDSKLQTLLLKTPRIWFLPEHNLS